MLQSKHGINQEPCMVSEGWLANFFKRSGITKSVRLHGQCGSIDPGAVKKEMELCLKFQNHPARCIYDTGFFYKLLHNLSYSAPEEKRKKARGTKGIRAEKSYL